MKLLINKCYGGFGLSNKAMTRYKAESGNPVAWQWDIERDDELLVKIVEELGKESWGDFSQLEIVNVPDGVKWQIDEYDGMEWVAEKHRTWD